MNGIIIIILARRQNSLYAPNHHTLKWYMLLFQYISSFALNSFKEQTLIRCSGSLFHVLTTRLKNNFSW